MTAEFKVVGEITEVGAGAASNVEFGGVQEETTMDRGVLEIALPNDGSKLALEEVDPPPKVDEDSGDCSGLTNDQSSDVDPGDPEEDIKDDTPTVEMIDVGGGGRGDDDPDQHSYVFVDSQNSGGGDSSSDWDINVDNENDDEDPKEDLKAAVPQAEAEVDDKVVERDSDKGAETRPTPMSAQYRENIVPPSDCHCSGVGLSSPHVEEDNQNSTFAADVASEKEQPLNPVAVELEAEAAAAVTKEQLEHHVLVVPDLIRDGEAVLDQVVSETSPPFFLEVDNQTTTVVAPPPPSPPQPAVGDVPQSHEHKRNNASESTTVLDSGEEDRVPEAVDPQDANDSTPLLLQQKNHQNDSSAISTATITSAHCNKSGSEEKEPQSLLVFESSEINDSIKGKKNPDDEEVEMTKLQTSFTEIVGRVCQAPSQPEATECTNLAVEVVETPTEVEKIPNAQPFVPEFAVAPVVSFLLDNGEVEKPEEEGVKSGLEASLKEHEEGPQLKVDDNLSTEAIDQEGNNEVPELTHETNISSEPELKLHKEDEAMVTKDTCDCRIQVAALQNDSSENDNLHSPDDSMKPESEGGDRSYLVNNGTEVTVEVTEASEEVNEIFVTEKASDSSCTDIESMAHSQPLAAGFVIPVVSCHVNGGVVHDAGSSDVDMISDSENQNSSSTNGRGISCTDAAAISHTPVQFGSFVPEMCEVNDVFGDDSNKITCLQVEDIKQVHRSDVSNPLLPLEGFSAHPVVEQNMTVEVESVERPFNFLIRMPKYYDDELNGKIREAAAQLAEKTQERDAIRAQIQMIKGNVQQAQSHYADTLSEERAARRLIRLKRQEIDSVQSVINRVKNAISVEDIDTRIKHMEHMMQHETLPLKEEKQFIREIKQLRHHREQLSSNMGSQDEVQQAFDQRDQIEEQLKILKKDLDSLKTNISTAEAATAAAYKILKDEKKRLEEVYVQHGAANIVRQEAYLKWQNLRRESGEKNSHFWMYRNDLTAAIDYASSGDKGALHRLCQNQVEKMMELWNTNDEFRNEYIRCNTRSTIWRLKTMDGRALGPDEESPVFASFVDERIKSSSYKVGQVKPSLEKREEQLPTTEAAEITEGESREKVATQTSEAEKSKKLGKLAMRNSSPPINSLVGSGETLEEPNNKQANEQHVAMKEQEVATKEKLSRKAEEEAKLREQRRLEEIAKAKEAMERKRKNAEKAQIRAEVRALKEAEQKEKEKERRVKKKERKKSGAGGDSNSEGGDVVPTSEAIDVMTVKGTETKEGYPPSPTGAATSSKRPQKAFSKQLNKMKTYSSVPQALRNRNKRRMQQWIWGIASIVVVVALIFLGGMGFNSKSLGGSRQMGNPGF